eukprot:TRINITY_DN9570_c0_g1_i3.p1 TRINITY_DN9570_c0_g1~~TRINITY_DN9570_c0_g1_i3.p1  ORF type:complete len:518 (-),score=143.28 TRINITY_DN9570_c0_g1_i3:394-1947(-)
MDSGLVDEFLAEASEALEPDQRILNQKDGVTVISKKTQGVEHDMIKAWGVVPAPAHCCYRALAELQERRSWDHTAKELSAVDNIDHNTSIYYTLVEGIFGMQPRDFVDIRHMVVLPNGVHVIVFAAIEHPSRPELPGIVRGTTLLAGQLIKPIDEHSCMLTTVTQVDIKGNIPVYLVNKVATRSPIEWFHALRVHLNSCVHTLPATQTSSDMEYLHSKLRRCNRAQLIGIVRSLTEAKASLVPVIAAGVATAMAKRKETEYMIAHTHEDLVRFDEVSIEALSLSASTDLDCSQLVKMANAQTKAVLADTLQLLKQSSTGYSPSELVGLIQLNASLRTQVNDYSEAIYNQALRKAAQFEDKFNQKCGIAPLPCNTTYSERISRWWYGSEQQQQQQRMQLPQVGSNRERAASNSGLPPSLEQSEAEENSISSLADMLGVGAQLSKRLELTSVKKLLRLHKYRSFSFEELTQISNGHIADTEVQIARTLDQVRGWEAAEQVLAVCSSNAELARKVSDQLW